MQPLDVRLIKDSGRSWNRLIWIFGNSAMTTPISLSGFGKSTLILFLNPCISMTRTKN